MKIDKLTDSMGEKCLHTQEAIMNKAKVSRQKGRENRQRQEAKVKHVKIDIQHKKEITKLCVNSVLF